MARTHPAHESINRDVSLQRLVETAGISLRPKGKTLVGTCPFHKRKAGTFVVDPKANTWTCDACKMQGGPVEWVMRFEGVSHRHAVELLKQDGFAPGQGGARAKRSTTTKMPTLLAPDVDDTILMQQVVDYYHDCLKQSTEALAYLERRGLRHAELIDRFKLGYCNRTLGYRIPQKNRAAGAGIREALTRVGILRDTGHELLRGSIVVPVFDSQGRVVQMYGRKITEGLRAGTPEHVWLPGTGVGLVNGGCLSATCACQAPAIRQSPDSDFAT